MSEQDPSRHFRARIASRENIQYPTSTHRKTSGEGSAKIWPSNTVSVKRLDQKKNLEAIDAWDLAMDFNLADFATQRDRRVPAVIRRHIDKGIQQYQKNPPAPPKEMEDLDISDDDDEQYYPAQLHRTYSFDRSHDTAEVATSPPRGESDGHDEDEYCCNKARDAIARGRGGVYFCYGCSMSTFCDDCWAKQVAHRRETSKHRKVDITIARIIQDTLDRELTEQEQAELHLLDECTSWFGAAKGAEGAIFRDFGRYAELVAERNSSERKRCYPALVSFVGETGAGKSSLIKLLVSTQAPGTTTRTPVVGSTTNAETPTSGDVHLYADPHTHDTNRPLFYADCEGLHGGTLDPMGVKLKSRRLVPPVNKNRTASFDKHVRRRHETAEREIVWANTPEKTTRKFFVENLYPRLLYTFSDVIVFVVRNARTIEDVVEQLITWADAVIETSSNQPVLPHAIIVLNFYNNKDGQLWDVTASTTSLLNNVRASVSENPTLKKYAEKLGYRINTAESLLLSYYSSIRVLRVPEKTQPQLVHQQIQTLYEEISNAAAASHEAKHKVRMRLNCEELQPYLHRAFDHFCSDLDEAFDFVKASYLNSSIPGDFSGNILKVAVNVVQIWQNKIDGPLLFRELSFIVASCVMLDAVRQGKLGTAARVFPEYLDHFDEALDDFCEKYWPCEFVSPQGRCVNVKAGHQKGHQSRLGVRLGPGDYESSFTAQEHRPIFRNDIFARLRELLDHLRLESQGAIPEREAAAKLHRSRILGPFFRHWGGAELFACHSACLACLVSPARESLPCGHVLCTQCLKDFGFSRGTTVIEMRFCPLHDTETSHFRWPISITPSNAGIRILTIDGGGARGIIPLMVLKSLETKLGMPIQNFFDLMIGTSTGGLITLGLGEKGWSVKECISKFKSLVSTAFTKPRTFGWEFLDFIITAHNNGKYKTEPLERLLQAEYGYENLFGRSMGPQISSVSTPSPCKVGVTATRTLGGPCLLANYNRPEQEAEAMENDNQPTSPRNENVRYEEKSRPYDFVRAETSTSEIRTWEAARATSAAPKLFKPFAHAASGETFIDGAVYFNNPIEVALREHKLIWPKSRSESPDVLLSLGTGHTYTKKPRPSDSSMFGVVTHYKHLLKIAVDHVKNSQNSQEQYGIVYQRTPPEVRKRFVRITVPFPRGLPKPDDVGALQFLEEEIHRYLNGSYSDIKDLVNRLIATSFYFEPSSSDSTKNNKDGSIEISGLIRCRIPPQTPELRKFGELLRSRCQEAYTNSSSSRHSPSFVIEEQSKETDAQQVPLAPKVVSGMIDTGFFNLGQVRIKISSPVSQHTSSR